MLTAPVFVHGVAFWSPPLPDWARAAAALRGDETAAQEGTARPAARVLGGNERRRASESVQMALHVAHEACRAAELDPAALPSVFASAHGDLAIVDALCRSLARDPLLLSPLCFHHSVHNAASGYWAIAVGCTQASSALAAGEHSFAAGWLEAASQCLADDREVLLVGCDTAAIGPLLSVNPSRGQLALALVLGSRPRSTASRRIDWRLLTGLHRPPPLTGSRAIRSLQANAMADALPLLQALADGAASGLRLPLSAHLALDLTVHKAAGAAPD